MVRNAEPRDRADTARLLYMAAPEVFDFFIPCDRDTILRIIEGMFDTNDAFMSGNCFRFSEEDGKIQGGVSVHPEYHRRRLEGVHKMVLAVE